MATSRAQIILRYKGDRSQNEYARFLGIDPSTLSRVLNDDRGSDFVIVKLLERFPEHAKEIAAALAASNAARTKVPA